MHFILHPDHYQFYLEDNTIRHDASRLWRHPQTTRDRLDVLPGMIAIGIGRYGGQVPVTVEILSAPPTDSDFHAWDHVTECSIAVKANRLLLTSPEEFGDGVPEIPILPGNYQVRLYYGDLDKIYGNAQMEGDDHYQIVIWAGKPIAPRVLKRKE